MSTYVDRYCLWRSLIGTPWQYVGKSLFQSWLWLFGMYQIFPLNTILFYYFNESKINLLKVTPIIKILTFNKLNLLPRIRCTLSLLRGISTSSFPNWQIQQKPSCGEKKRFLRNSPLISNQESDFSEEWIFSLRLDFCYDVFIINKKSITSLVLLLLWVFVAEMFR